MARSAAAWCLLALLIVGAPPSPAGVEIGGTDAPPVHPRHSAPLKIWVGPTIGWRFLTDQAMSETYGTVAIPGLMSATDLADDTRFVLAAGYGFARGDPFYDVTGFEGPWTAELTTIPVQVGLQSDLAPHPRLHILCGLSAELVWMQERLAAAAVAGSADYVVYDGWGEGLRVSFGPEWRAADARRAVGFTLDWGVSGGEVFSRAGSTTR
ncbi:MAG: hypothetical protein IPI34_06550 [bacterium]|nr:hypothetical protein [bacterium]